MLQGNVSHITEPSDVPGRTFGLSDEITHILQWILFNGICQAITVFGIVTNIINIMCFVKQGFKDPVNISLLGLSISDLGCLVTLLCTTIFFMIPSIAPAELPFEAIDFNYLVFFMPHLGFARVTSWTTAIITLERCLCIVAPLKVKSLLTHKRMTTIIVCMFVVLFFSGTPIYAVNRLGLKFFPERNKTIIGVLYSEGRAMVETISFLINSFFIPVTAFILIVICTVILVFKLHTLTAWQKSTRHGSSNVTSRNQKVAKMVVMISVLFISCFIPLTIVMLAVAFQPQLAVNGKYVNIGIVLGGVCFILESINSSVNIFIYYHMSSKYKVTFHTIFCNRREINTVEDIP